MNRQQKKEPRIRAELERLADHGLHADDDLDELAQERAQAQVEEENTLLWAYYHATDCTQQEAMKRVIDDPDERPTQSQASRVIRAVDDDILERDLPLSGTKLSGSWFGENDAVETMPAPQVEVLKDTIARLLITSHAVEDLYWPESSLGAEDVPEWMVPGDTNPLDIKADQYWQLGFDESNLAPAVKRHVSRSTADD